MEMRPEDFPGQIAGSYEEACGVLGVQASDDGYGLVLDQDESGARWTRVTTDVQGVRAVRSIWHSGVECGYEPPPGTVAATLPGWPVDSSLGLLGLPAPFDPPGALRPPDRSETSLAAAVDRSSGG